MGCVEQGGARLVPESERMSIAPKYVGLHPWLMVVESTIFAQLGSMCPAYTGGYWEMVETGNDAYFLWPRMATKERGGLLELSAENGTTCLVTPEAAGMVASLYGFNKMCWSTRLEKHVTLFQNLMDFARTHPEWVSIKALID
jgi:hypothetical protein